MHLNCGAGEDLRVPWNSRRSNPSILKDISPGCSLEGLMLKLKLQYSGHLMWRANSLEKTLMLGKIEGRRRGGQRMRWLDVITDSVYEDFGGFQELLMDWEASRVAVMGWQESDMTEWLNWTELNVFCPMSESLSGKREGFQDSAIHKKESLLLTRVRAFCCNQRSGAGSEKALSRGCYPNL